MPSLQSASEEDLQAVPDIGPIVAAHIVHFFQEPHNKEVIDKLLKAGIHWKNSNKDENRPLNGKTFVITGILKDMSRNEAKERLEKLGAVVTGSVSAKTSFVIVGSEPGSKYDQAKKRGIAILDDPSFHALLKKHESSL